MADLYLDQHAGMIVEQRRARALGRRGR